MKRWKLCSVASTPRQTLIVFSNLCFPVEPNFFKPVMKAPRIILRRFGVTAIRDKCIVFEGFLLKYSAWVLLLYAYVAVCDKEFNHSFNINCSLTLYLRKSVCFPEMKWKRMKRKFVTLHVSFKVACVLYVIWTKMLVTTALISLSLF